MSFVIKKTIFVRKDILHKFFTLISYKHSNLPHDCKNIEEVRNEIDTIDQMIMKLFGLRFQYVKQVVKYKELTSDSIIAAERREAVIEKRREWAVENALDPDIFEEIYRNLIDYFIKEEMKLVNLKP